MGVSRHRDGTICIPPPPPPRPWSQQPRSSPPVAITCRNSRSISRRCRSAPGDFIGNRTGNEHIHLTGLPINTSQNKVLRQPVESTQYTADTYRDACTELGITQSMGTVGDSYDNAMAESFFASLK